MSESPREILKKARYVDRRIAQIYAERDQLNQDMQALRSFDYSKPIVKASSGRSEVESTAVRIADRKRQLAKELKRQLDIRATATDLVYSLPPGPERDVLYQRYILGKSWKLVADTVHYEQRYCVKLHNAALEKMTLKDTV